MTKTFVVKVILSLIGFFVAIEICHTIVIMVIDDDIQQLPPVVYEDYSLQEQPPEDVAHELDIRNNDVLRLSFGSFSGKNFHNSSNYIDDMAQRVKLQQVKIDHYCSRVSGSHDTWPYNNEVLKHLIFDDTHKVIYCYVPKVGCTMMKTTFLLLQNIYTLEELEGTPDVDHKHYLSKVRTFCMADTNHQSNALHCEPMNKIRHKLRTYYKFMIIRNPFERLVSAYNEKMTRLTTSDYYIMKQKLVLQHTREHSTGPYPNFQQFIDVLVNTNILNDDHFEPMVNICNPCGVKYNMYINFNNLNHEIDQLLHLLNIPRKYYFNKIKHDPLLMPQQPATASHLHFNDSTITPKYYKQLPAQLIEKLLDKYFYDIHFISSIVDDYKLEQLYKSLFV